MLKFMALLCSLSFSNQSYFYPAIMYTFNQTGLATAANHKSQGQRTITLFMLEMCFCGTTCKTKFILQIKFPLCFLGDLSSKEVILTPKFYP